MLSGRTSDEHVEKFRMKGGGVAGWRGGGGEGQGRRRVDANEIQGTKMQMNYDVREISGDGTHGSVGRILCLPPPGPSPCDIWYLGWEHCRTCAMECWR